MWENTSEMILSLTIAGVILIWTIVKYYTNTKGEYRRSLLGFAKELYNNLFWLGRRDVAYPERDKFPPE